jgi:hypothetical protein
LEGKANLVQLRQEISLSEAEIAAVEDGIDAMESLLREVGRYSDACRPNSAGNKGPLYGHEVAER